MTKDDVMKLAREAGLHLYVNDLTEEPYALVVERFANLVADAKRATLIQQIRYWALENLDTELLSYLARLKN